jgi:HTH-type transcriptional regulator/antitoxin HipB
MEFGRALRERRRALGLTQDEVVLQAGVGRRFYIELEAGKPGASLGPAIRCAQILGLDISLTPRGDG